MLLMVWLFLSITEKISRPHFTRQHWEKLFTKLVKHEVYCKSSYGCAHSIETSSAFKCEERTYTYPLGKCVSEPAANTFL